MKQKLLIIDDDEEIRTQLKWALGEEYSIVLAGDHPTAMEAFREHQPAVVLLDLGLPPHTGNTEVGFALLSEILAQDAFAKVIVLTGQAEKSHAIKAIGAGASDFLAKPVLPEELEIILKRTFHLAALERENRELQQRVGMDAFQGMLGTSPQIQHVFTAIRKVASTDAPVLILGESGTGKEMAALAVHRSSRRKDGPFAAINCSAIPETLLESELFGHEKGSFTGAHAQRKGRIENAASGTLFLDEIGEVPPPVQVKLLRFLQDKSFERIGGRQSIQVNARVIAATNSDLKKAMLEGRFREDLYYRLAVVVLHLPPLRERESDVCLLAHDFLRRFAAETGKDNLSFDTQAVRALVQHSWPGNIRELQNRVKRGVIMTEGKRLTARDLELEGSASTAPTLKEAREAVEREMILQALRKHGGKITPAAAELRISRPTFYELMEKLGIQRPERGLTSDTDFLTPKDAGSSNPA